MKKITAILFFAWYCLSNVFSQNYTHRVEYRTKQGDTTHYHLACKTTFDDKGCIVEEVHYNDKKTLKFIYADTVLTAVEQWIDGALMEIEKHTYNRNGQWVKSEIERKGQVVSSDTFVYDTKGFLIEETHYYEDATAERTMYVNNSNGKPTTETEWELNTNGLWEMKCSSTSKWNENGKLLEWENSVCKPSRNARETWCWDANGRLIKHQIFTREGALYREDNYTYQEGGYQVISTGFDYNGNAKHLKTASWEYQPQYYWHCTTDEAGRLTEEKIVDENGKMISLRIFRYDENGNLLLEVYCNADRTLNYSHKYEYN